MTSGDSDDVDVAIMVAATMKWRKEVDRLSRQVAVLREALKCVEGMAGVLRDAHLAALRRGGKDTLLWSDLDRIRKAARDAVAATKPEA